MSLHFILISTQGLFKASIHQSSCSPCSPPHLHDAVHTPQRRHVFKNADFSLTRSPSCRASPSASHTTIKLKAPYFHPNLYICTVCHSRSQFLWFPFPYITFTHTRTHPFPPARPPLAAPVAPLRPYLCLCALWPLTFDPWWFFCRGREAAAGVDSGEPAEGEAWALCAGRFCVSVHTHTCTKATKKIKELYILSLDKGTHNPILNDCLRFWNVTWILY